MKKAAFAFVALFIVATAAPAHAQLGGLGKLKKLGDKAVDTKSKVDDLTFSEAEERQIGEQVSVKLRERFGVYQDEAVTKYVSLVGSAIAQAGTRPSLDWKFIVLDTDGVNAYAAPGGFIHVTRGLLGLLKNEAELAGVLGHEIAHVTAKHTLEAIRRSKITTEASDAAGGGSLRNQIIARAVGFSYERVFDGAYSRGDENESDKVGVQTASKVGYAAHGLADALQKVADRNASRSEPNGFFVSHPVIKDRIASIEKVIASEKLAGKATVDARYRQFITFDAKPITEIAADVDDAAGLASGGKKKEDDKDAKKEEPKKSKLSGVASITGNKQAASTQQTASAGARGGIPDRDAKGGPNKNALAVKVTAADLEAFKKGIAS
jgi:predicted Zn-dependent protease